MYGICNLTLFPMRAEPSDRSEMVSQILFGECYRIIDNVSEKKWLKIETFHDQYQGWIDRFQHFELSEKEFELIAQNSQMISMEVLRKISNINKVEECWINIVIGSRFPCSDRILEKLGKTSRFITKLEAWETAGNIAFRDSSQKTDFPEFQKIALKFIHTPYLWGGRTPFGIDCSGFTQQVFGICGYQLKRDAYQQATQGHAISFEDRKAGDLAFFQNQEGRIIHVGILLEDDKITHASSWVRIDQLDEKGIFCVERNEYSHSFHSLRRILEA
ncbi:MAG: C40 family peptidase [Verrucomicrobia bacterium]|nr:C40 family peptidase [Cytophagales bacterium]